jgi:hypothetical protein
MCCLSISSVGGVGVFFIGNRMSSGVASGATATPKPSRVVRARIGRKIRTRRPARRGFKKAGKGLLKAAKFAWKYHPKNVVKRAALRAFNRSRIGKKFNRSKVGKKFNRGIKKAGRSIKNLFRRRYFDGDTPVKLQNGETRYMKDLELGDILENGSVVKATMEILNENDVYYKLPGDILVTGSHYVKDGDTFKRVKNLENAELTDKINKTVYCLITSDHNIPVGEFTFWDWEDVHIIFC